MVDSRGGVAQDSRRAERLELRVPTTPTQLPAVRAMAADLAMRMDYDLDSVEDLRLAVDEACATLAQIAAGDARLTVVFETSRAGLPIHAWVPTTEGTEAPRVTGPMARLRSRAWKRYVMRPLAALSTAACGWIVQSPERDHRLSRSIAGAA